MADYSYLSYAYLALYEATQKTKYLDKTKKLLSWMIDKFEDKEKGGFFESDTSDKTLIFKMKDFYDSAIPSANSIAVKALFKYSEITGDDNFKKMAIKTLESFGSDINMSPSGSPFLLSAASKLNRGHEQIVIVSDSKSRDVDDIVSKIYKLSVSDPALIFLTTKENKAWFENQNSHLEDMVAIDGKTTIYYCRNFTCEKPVFSVEELSGLS